jgi:predicted nucleic-acid-binding protein
MIFLDANILIRILVEDDEILTKKAKELFKKILKNKQKCLIEDSVVAEILWVCTSKKLYNQPKEEVAARLIALLSPENIFHPYKASLIFALDKYSQLNLDFVDCLAISYQQTGVVGQILTFDKQIKKLVEVR